MSVSGGASPSSDRLIDDPRFATGVHEFNAGNHFEAHEAWEAVWNDAIGPEKQLCQGLVQIAAGYHKLSLGIASGARKLLERGLRLLRAADGTRHGIKLTTFCNAVAADLARLQRVPLDATVDLSLARVPVLETDPISITG